ncbi:hypothetical protein CDIK_2023 [Cucumispora dikerogammari]|nr:hypothetical protein CDIK_2023 [Cucumispora dikerogammari]
MVRIKYRYLTLHLSNTFCIKNAINTNNNIGFQSSFTTYILNRLEKDFGLFISSRFYFRCINVLVRNRVLIVQIQRDQTEFYQIISDVDNKWNINILNTAGSVRTAKIKFLKNKIFKGETIGF